MTIESIKSVRLVLLSVILIMVILGCDNKKQARQDCTRYEKSNYATAEIDSSMREEVYKGYQSLLNEFKMEPLKGSYHDAYQLLYYSSNGSGESVKFEYKWGRYIMSVACTGDTDWKKVCKEYKIVLEEEDWIKLQTVIYEYDFWTAPNFRDIEKTGGYIYLLEGNRPGAEECNLETNKLIARNYPKYDKMGDLCKNILDLKLSFQSRYEKSINVIK